MEERLIAEINNDKIKYGVFYVDENLDYKLVTKISSNSGISRGKIIDFDSAAKIINEDLQYIEKEVKKIFKNISVILNEKDLYCTNLTGFKKLNGSKVEKRFRLYIKRSEKFYYQKSKKNSILHILNSKFILDKTKQNNMPLNIFGDHLSLHMTFISIQIIT